MGLKTVMIMADRVLGMTVAEHGDDPKKPTPVGESNTAMMSLGIGLCVAFVILTARMLTGDFSAEEIPVVRFVMSHSVTNIFAGPIHADTHPLYHALLWHWFRTFQGANEAFLRLPNVLLMLGTAYVAFTGGKRLFRSPGMAWVLIGLILMSPVTIHNFAWTFGYTLSIFLSTVATVGALFIASEKRLVGICLLTPSLLLLPWVIPNSLAVGVTLSLFLLVHFALSKKLKLNLLYVLLVLIISLTGYASLAYSLGVEKGESVPSQGYGPIIAVWVLAILAQVGLFIATCIVAKRQKDLPPEADDPERTAATDAMMRHLPALTIIAAVVGAVALVAFTVAPLDCMALLVPVSFGAIGWYDRRVNRVNKYFFIMMMAIFGNQLMVSRVSRYLTRKDVANGRYAKNLLQRYDSGSTGASFAAEAIARARASGPSRIFVQPEILTSFSFYWRSLGGNPDHVEALEENTNLALEPEHYPYFTIFAVGHGMNVLRTRLDRALKPVAYRPVPSPPDVIILHVLPPPPPEFTDPKPSLEETTPIAWEGDR